MTSTSTERPLATVPAVHADTFAELACETARLIGIELCADTDAAIDTTLEQARCRLEDVIDRGSVPVGELPEACTVLLRIDAMQHARAATRSSSDVSGLVGVAELTQQLDAFDLDDLLDSGAATMCRSMGFHRTLFSVVSDSTWRPRFLFTDPSAADDTTELRAFVADAAWRLDAAPLESEVVRRRLPRMVNQAQESQQTFKPLMRVSQSAGYVVAPIWVRRRVVGLLHADRWGDPITADDLTRVEAYAECFGAATEKALLRRRVRTLAQRWNEVLSSAAAEVAAVGIDARAVGAVHGPAGVRPPPRPDARPVESGSPAADLADRTAEGGGGGFHDDGALATLSPRETDVLVELARGRTNAEIATRLGVAEGTVKCYVKGVLRKLEVSSRFAAAAYLRRSQSRPEERMWG